MATFFFETITDAQAAAYTEGDTLVFSGVGETACHTTVRFQPATADKGPTIAIISGVTGKVREFPAILGQQEPVFPDGSKLFREDDPVVVVGSAPPMPTDVMDRIFADRGPESQVITLDVGQDPDWDRAAVLDFRPAIELDRKLHGNRGSELIFCPEQHTYPFGGQRHGPPPRVLGPRGHQAGRRMGRHIG